MINDGKYLGWADYEVSGNALKVIKRIYEKIVKEVNDEKEITN